MCASECEKMFSAAANQMVQNWVYVHQKMT